MPIKDKSKRAEYDKKYRESRAQQIRDSRKKWYNENREFAIQKSRDRYLENRDDIRKSELDKYAALSPDARAEKIARNKKWAQANRDKTNAYKRKYELKKKNEVFDLLGRKCAVCGFSDERALQIDHINGGGNKERKSMRGRKLYAHILSLGGVGYQILCANCNWIKRIENSE